MKPRDQAKEILAHLIRRRFKSQNTYGVLTTGPHLISIAQQVGLPQLAAQMELDLRLELPPHHKQGSTIAPL